MAAKKTLLEIVQSILNDLESDSVNSVSDTIESQQVASICEDVYYNMISEGVIPEHKELFKLTGLSDTSMPTWVNIPTNILEVEWLKYNTKDSGATDEEWKDIPYVSPKTFIDRTMMRKVSSSNVTAYTDTSGIALQIVTDKDPEYWTTFDDETLVFDSFDSAIDSTLQTSKTLAFGTIEPSFDRADDDFTPDFDSRLFPLYLAECKNMCFVILKQQQNPKTEQQARRGRIRRQVNKNRTRATREESYNRGTPDFGRK